VKGAVTSSSDGLIEVSMPPQSRLHNLTVTNISSRLSAKSQLKVTPVFSGEGYQTPLRWRSRISMATKNLISC
jgi:hypothetical protein